MAHPPIDLTHFDAAYLETADRVFLRPDPRYRWEDIVTGITVSSSSGRSQRMSAVGQNTFRGFHRINKSLPGAKPAFTSYFGEQQWVLLDAISAVRTRKHLNRISKRICRGILPRLGNCRPTQLRSYNKIRKPVDLYIEHLVSMAVELDEHRATLVPLLFLPLDSQILAHPCLFGEQELVVNGLSRSSTYKDIETEAAYLALQDLLAQKAHDVAVSLGQPFHVIYFDLCWNGRDRSQGLNLFQTNL